jgi:hypothetical protein
VTFRERGKRRERERGIESEERGRIGKSPRAPGLVFCT